MTPKEKAKELVNKYFNILYGIHIGEYSVMDEAKECALIAVDEMIKYCHAEHIQYWNEVKTEIQNL